MVVSFARWFAPVGFSFISYRFFFSSVRAFVKNLSNILISIYVRLRYSPPSAPPATQLRDLLITPLRSSLVSKQ